MHKKIVSLPPFRISRLPSIIICKKTAIAANQILDTDRTFIFVFDIKFSAMLMLVNKRHNVVKAEGKTFNDEVAVKVVYA